MREVDRVIDGAGEDAREVVAASSNGGSVVVDRAIDVLTRAEAAMSALRVEAFAESVLSDPVDTEDWIATDACVHRLLARVQTVTAIIRSKSA